MQHTLTLESRMAVIDTPSQQAMQKIAPHISHLERIVLDALADHGPMTASELAAVTCVDYASLQPRPGQMFKRGLVRKTGKQRKNAKGNNETVWEYV